MLALKYGKELINAVQNGKVNLRKCIAKKKPAICGGLVVERC
jgi:hypothetical protein